MKLSILTCSLRDRPGPVIDKLIAQAERHPDAEILWLGDNRRRSIGLKRQALLDIARGARIAFVDDDDDVPYGYISRLLDACRSSSAPVITFDAVVKYDAGWPDCYIECEVLNENEQAVPGGRIKRAAWHIHAWRIDIARLAVFPDSNWIEDWGWAQHIQPNRPCPRIPVPLYFYRERGAPPGT